MGREKDTDGDEGQTTGCSPGMCAQTKGRAEDMAVNSAVRRALTAIEECKQLPTDNQITKVTIMHSTGWLSRAFNDTVYEYLERGFPDVVAVPGVGDEDYRYCHFHIQKIEKKSISLQFWDIAEQYNEDTITLATKGANDSEEGAGIRQDVAEQMEMRYLMALLRERSMAADSA
jgi:hypothetical protein